MVMVSTVVVVSTALVVFMALVASTVVVVSTGGAKKFFSEHWNEPAK